MDLNELQDNRQMLFQDIVKSCWLIVLLYAASTSTQWFFTSHDKLDFLLQAIVLPVCGMTALNLLMGWAMKHTVRLLEYKLIFGVNLFAVIIIESLYELPIVLYSLIIPVLLSLYFYSRPLILFALVQSIATVLLVLAMTPTIRSEMRSSDLIMLFALLIATAIILNNLRKYSYVLLNKLIQATQEKQDLQTKNVMMERISRVDSATGLFNHRAFHEHLSTVLDMSRTQGTFIHLAILDIDFFKRVNDTYGHAAGDTIIQFVAHTIQAHVDPEDFASRYGGEEFTVLSLNKDPDRFLAQMETIRQAIAEVSHPVLNGASITVSIGVQRFRAGMSKEVLFQEADSALYEAKRSGKNRIVFAEAE